MGYRRLFVWVEGEDDVRFFDKIMKPKFQKMYDFIETRRFAALKREKVHNFLRSIKAMNADYIYVTDINDTPCVTAKKQEIKSKISNIDKDRIMVVIKEIEGWYLAGLKDHDVYKYNINPFRNTDDITKEQFSSLIPKNFDSRIDFMLEVLKSYSIEIAMQRNKSFRYFIEKFN